MAKRLLPTTKTQVSGHRFMRRRVEHGLLFGDVRMIHDPLGARRRASIFGLVSALMIAGVMGLFAWMRPNPDPGDAPILRTADGALYVRVGETAHPVANLTSARLVAGVAANPERAGEQFVAALPRGVPVGIVAAPGLFASADSGADSWFACATADAVIVRAGEAPSPLPPDRAVLAALDGREWIVTREGRTELPPQDSKEGRMLRRGLAIDANTPRWSPLPQVLGALRELPPYEFPPTMPVLESGADSWLLVGEAVAPITELQKRLLIDAGSQPRPTNPAELASRPDASPPLDLRLPATAPDWLDPGTQAVCAGPTGEGAVMERDAALAGAIELSGDTVATHFAGLAAGAVGVDSGHGYHVVSPAGLRHPVADAETLAVIGVARTDEVRWELVSLLPEGEALTRDAALRALY